ncbi:MAG TPA: magnesium/cobalt transporter CorA [Candidatus Polarisedimenticolia bacterium]|nr:magnesium/cobalt transporter CorA [Candidatus Polarisedimenticolia bacterium]
MEMKTRKRKPPGLPPGEPMLTEEALPPRIHAIRYSPAGVEESDLSTAQECHAFASAEGTTWIDVQGLADLELLRALGELFGLHPLAIEDVVSLRQRPKADDYDSHMFIIARMPEVGGARAGTDQTSLFLGPRFLITFQEHYGDCLDPVRERLRRGKGLMRRSGPDYLAYAILDAVIDGYFPLLEAYGETLEALEDEVVDRPIRASLERIHDARRDLLTLRRAVWPMRDAVNSLVREESDLISDQTRLYLRDCYDHSVQILDMVETYRELAAGLMDIYISSLSQKLNEVMKVLTIIATIFIPLTFVVGLYGMNFEHMPELKWRYGYPAVLVAMAIMGLFMLVYFIRKGWIGPEEVPAGHLLKGRLGGVRRAGGSPSTGGGRPGKPATRGRRGRRAGG